MKRKYQSKYSNYFKKGKQRAYRPNHIPEEHRTRNILFSLFLIIYGTIGVIIDDIFIFSKRSRGIHLHGLPCKVMYGAMLFGAISLLTVVIDHYDKRNNETNYRFIEKSTRYIAWFLFFLSFIIEIFFSHQATKGHY